jgi:hypothetical protein
VLGVREAAAVTEILLEVVAVKEEVTMQALTAPEATISSGSVDRPMSRRWHRGQGSSRQ